MLVVPDEGSFIKQYLESLSSRSVRFDEDYCSRQLPSPLRIKRQPAPPNTKNVKTEPEESTAAAPTSAVSDDTATIDVIVKILKPASQLTVGNVSVNDTVSELKNRIYQLNNVPANRQKLLLKGKVLADSKALKDYNISNGATVHLMVSAAPAKTSSTASSTRNTNVTRHGLSEAGVRAIDSAEFWQAIEKTVTDQLNQEDAAIVLNKMKDSLK
ncbi:hypothetical protein VTP01DRAFT_8851 [Rhizomucor pusillus]|uniref:uncharacterized protein n=1 Tax=Rhizomucor pusillus TaxID=4840 RepID=UPI0037423C0C